MKNFLLLAVTGSAAAALAIGVPGTAGAAANSVIKVDKSINRIKVGNTKKSVIKKMGQPKSVTAGVNGNGRHYKMLKYKHRFTVTIVKGAGVEYMLTKSGKQRTFDGIGVGSTRAQVEANYPVACEAVPGKSAWQLCLTHEPVAGETTTTFRIKNDFVKQVGVGTFFD